MKQIHLYLSIVLLNNLYIYRLVFVILIMFISILIAIFLISAVTNGLSSHLYFLVYVFIKKLSAMADICIYICTYKEQIICCY